MLSLNQYKDQLFQARAPKREKVQPFKNNYVLNDTTYRGRLQRENENLHRGVKVGR